MNRILSLVFVIIICCTACKKKKSTKSVVSQEGLVQRDTAKGAEISLSQHGMKTSMIYGDILVRERKNLEEKIYLYNGVKIIVFEHGEVVNEITSKMGWYDQNHKVVWLNDSVEVKNKKNELLKTDSLSWADSTHQFFTNSPLEIYTNAQTIKGKGLRADESFNHYTIFQITGSVLIDKPNTN